MIKYKETKVPEHVDRIVESVSCDMCGRVYKGAEALEGCVFWGAATCQLNNTSLYIRTKAGERHYHICPDCFELKLEPWLKRQGIRFTEVEPVNEQILQRLDESWKTGEERLAELFNPGD